MQGPAREERPRSVLLAGGGLANSLIAFRLADLRPEVEVTLVEGGAALGGRHTWSFFESDLTPETRWVEPFVVRRWPLYDVRFPERRRRLRSGYCSVTSERLHEVLAARLPGRLRLGARIRAIDPAGATLEDGERIEADVVIDGRGPGPMPDLVLGWQKFLGLTVALEAPHGLEGPIIMDATVDQEDGYRFVYVLPWDERVVLIEDTRYSDGAALDRERLRACVRDYAAVQGWRIREILDEEEGVLPVALEGDIDAHWRRAEGRSLSGLRAGLFHPTTGYSLPDALLLAEAIGALPQITHAAVEALVRTRSTRLWKERAIFRLVNRMLFRAALPGQRYRVLQRFYGLPEPLIRRFYAARLTRLDKLRLLAGRPPVPFGAALHCIEEKGAS